MKPEPVEAPVTVAAVLVLLGHEPVSAGRDNFDAPVIRFAPSAAADLHRYRATKLQLEQRLRRGPIGDVDDDE